jgi:hypothetical protein
VQQRVAEFVDQSLDGLCRPDGDLVVREVAVAVLGPRRFTRSMVATLEPPIRIQCVVVSETREVPYF